ncbi:hypothetical protein CALVIDRAFT_559894 [Calocera viscosa TUFC12733]|uniref:DUF6533 domain-containing protein n=1 Tax=Calocera viscosa (strain TUFC12733) TaxID=1330018 RepID=A0A167RTK4_CALVF|nr:hypothetical protein CALVIDRAFT_559894 [Calocera viscosa TUFC12733]
MSSPLQEIGEVLLGQNYGVCAGVSLMFFDYLITFPQEVHLIWGAKWTPGKVLFLVIRYFGLAAACVSLYVQFGTTVSTRSCTISMYWSLLSMSVISICASLVLALRTWAIWNKSIVVGSIVAVAWVTSTVCSLVYTIRSIMGSSPFGNVFGLPGCIDTTTTPAAADAVRVYAFACAYEIVIFSLTLLRGFQQLSKHSGLLLVLYRDAFVASIWSLGFGMTDVVLSATQNTNFYFWCLIGFAFSFIVPCRLVLNLRASTMELDLWDVATGRPSGTGGGVQAHSGRSRSTRGTRGTDDDEITDV